MNRAFRSIIFLVIVAVTLAAVPAAAQEGMETHLIQISLLVASKTGGSELADLPANTRQAIEDVRQFLPFKSYRLLDTALVRTQRGARTMLTGPDNREFRAAFSFDGRHEPGSLMVRSFELVEKIDVPPELLIASEGEKRPAATSSKEVLSSSFSAAVGQTVVVGTSRLNGDDEALMVLFTALP